MALEKLLKQIRVIIREEIEYALDKKLNESTKKNQKDTLIHGMNLMKELELPKKQVKKPSSSGQNRLSSIQDILNETRLSMEAASTDEEYPSMRFTSDSVVPVSPRNMIPDGYTSADVTPEVSKALTRDYSALMAKINEKKGV